MLQHRTVNLVILSTSDDGKDVSNETRYRRLQDFFLNAKLCYQSIGSFILSRIPKPFEGYTLAMDRTNWKFGRKHINFLVISVVAGSVSIPLVWKVLPQKTKRGNSNTAQRQAIMNRLPNSMLKCKKSHEGELGACELPHRSKRLSCDETKIQTPNSRRTLQYRTDA